MDIHIARAVIEDCPRLLELIKELAAYEKAPDAVTVALDHFEESGFSEKPVWWAFVAKTGNSAETQTKIIGFALYYIRYSTWKGRAMYLEDIVVTESMRGKGVGQMLFARLVEEAREKKFIRIEWQVLNWNDPAIQFYKKYPVTFDEEWLNCSMDVAL